MLRHFSDKTEFLFVNRIAFCNLFDLIYLLRANLEEIGWIDLL